jgi:hypothetical protein
MRNEFGACLVWIPMGVFIAILDDEDFAWMDIIML